MKFSALSALWCVQASTVNSFEIPFQLPFGLSQYIPLGRGADKADLFAFHKAIIEIPSVTGNEHDVGVYIADYLKKRNYTVERIPIATGSSRENVYAYLGKDRNPRTIVTSHIDVVPPHIPYSISGNTIHGRGSNDAKGSVATQVQAVEELRAAGKLGDGDIGLLYVVGEEVNGVGMEKANDLGIKLPKTVIFGEPTELKLAVSQKGIIMFRLDFEGKASHSGYPELGVSAIEHLISCLNSLLETDWPSTSKFGKTTFNIGTISGGAAANIVPANATAVLSIRVAADLDETIALVKSVVGNHEGVKLTIEVSLPPVPLDSDVGGFQTIVVSYFTVHPPYMFANVQDVPHLRGDFKRYLYGPGSITSAHGPNEHVAKADLLEAVEGYKKLILHALG